MKAYEAPEVIKIEFMTENILDGSIVEAGTDKDPVDLGPAINIFG